MWKAPYNIVSLRWGLKVADNLQEALAKWKEFLGASCAKEIASLVSSGKRSIEVNFSDIAQFDPEIAEALLDLPEDTIKTAEVAIQQLEIPNSENVRLRFFNLPASQYVKIRDIRAEHLNKFIVIAGIVRQSSDVRPQVVSAKFECPSCGNLLTIPQLDQTFREPSRCSCGRRGKFRLISKELVDSQRLVLEESPEMLEGGEQPKRLSVFLREDLVEPKMEHRTTPGAKIAVSGFVQEIPIPSKSGGQLTRFDLAVEANHIQPVEEAYEEIEITPEDEEVITTLAKDPHIYEKLIKSLAPSIYGHEDIKGALVLQLMGGIRKELKDGTNVKGDIHMLLVGDPGSAKSTLLMAISKIAPKSRYVAGRGASAAGITATVVKDEFLRGFALEAGAIVLANNGFLLLDEMDKMSKDDTSALHEAMAQSQVTISKANIQATLRARTTILAAANPKLGRFDPYQNLASQIDLPPTLINRFDLIFPVRDVPDKDTDSKIATHVLEQHQEPKKHEPALPPELLKKYVAYARKRVTPKLSQAAIDEIREFYVGLRNMPSLSEDQRKPIPISARQLEALIRLSEASARVRFAKQVTKEDARRAIAILKHCLIKVGVDTETGQLDIDTITTGIPASARNRIAVIQEIIRELTMQGKKLIPMEEIIAEAHQKNLTDAQVEEIIDRLKRNGEIFEPRSGVISKI